VREHRFLAEVLDDLETTMNWLDGRREGLGKEFEGHPQSVMAAGDGQTLANKKA